MGAYLEATGRAGIANLADSFKENLRADEGFQYDKVIEVRVLLEILNRHKKAYLTKYAGVRSTWTSSSH
jgi:hypothetical protein